MDAVTPEDFGYGSASTPADRGIALAAWAAAPGVKRMRAGVRYFTDRPMIFGPNTPLVDMEGALIDTTESQANFGPYQAALSFRNVEPGAAAQLPPLATSPSRGDYYLSIGAAPGGFGGILPSALKPGDILCVHCTLDYSYSGWRPYYKGGEFVEVEQVEGNIVRLTSPLRAGYPYDATQVRRVSNWRPRIIGGEGFHNTGPKAIRHLDLKWVTGARLEGISTGAQVRAEGIILDRCFGVSVEDCLVDQFIRGTADGIVDHYGLGIYNSQAVKVRGGRYIGGNHGISLGGDNNWGNIVCRDVDVSGAEIKAWYLAATSIHGNAEDVNFRGCTLDGGCTFGGDRITYSDCLIRTAPTSATATPNLSAAFFGVYTAEALGVNYSLINCRILAIKTAPGNPNLPVIDLGSQGYITDKTTRGGTIRLIGNTVEAPTHNRIVHIANNGSTNTDRRVEVIGLHVLDALQSGRVFDVATYNNSGASWGDIAYSHIFAKGGAIII